MKPIRLNTLPAQSDEWASEKKTMAFDPEDIFHTGLELHHIANTAYPIAHRKTIWKYRQPADRYEGCIHQSFSDVNRMCLYVHIPFCEKRCAFCEYTVSDDHNAAIESAYHQALLHELDMYAELIGSRDKLLAGFDIGGGTPSFIDPQKIQDILERVTRHFRIGKHFGVSIETTPKIAALHPERIATYKALGIDRISMGLQMVNPRLLKAYGRDINKIGYNGQAVENIRKAGFTRFNIDLMYGFAKQKMEDFKTTLDYTIRLGPEYITLYRMRYKGTRIAQEAPDIDLERVMAMYEMAGAVLSEAGYAANPGKNGFSRVEGDPGTSEYLTERVVRSTPYLGLGLGAQTFTNHLLAYNLGAADKRFNRYLDAVRNHQLPIQDLYHLPKSEAMAKMISVSFYFGEIDRKAFRMRFEETLEERFPAEIAFVLANDLMEYTPRSLRLTSRGAKVVNGIIALFYSDNVKAHLLTKVQSRMKPALLSGQSTQKEV